MGMSLVIRVECTYRMSVPEWYPLALIFNGFLISKVTVKCIASSFIIDNRDFGSRSFLNQLCLSWLYMVHRTLIC